ncbi:hypothetical protein QQF64_006652 [Cirrhinus molitorella]|uniref:Uncharacterized protein n=1 Tax=Cirrhinus molitorella TaxID=172907 RepID=A0ABR3MBX3_9TELE
MMRSDRERNSKHAPPVCSVLPLELLNAVYQDNDISPHNPNSKTVRKVPFLSLISGSAPVSCPNRTVCSSASGVRCRGVCVRALMTARTHER